MGEPGTKETLSLQELEAAANMRTGRKHVLSILVENKAGVLTRIAGLFARRGFNIDTLTVGPTDDEQLSRVTLTVDVGDEEGPVPVFGAVDGVEESEEGDGVGAAADGEEEFGARGEEFAAVQVVVELLDEAARGWHEGHGNGGGEIWGGLAR